VWEVDPVTTRSTNPRRFLSADEASEIERAIGEAETGTSGQIKVILVRHCWFGLQRKARKLFLRHALDNTSRRNCVMIMLVTSNRQFLVYGDRGIHEHVGGEFWRSIRNVMAGHFRSGRFAQGLCAGVREIGQRLAAHFPREEAGNELSNRIEYAS
jgi:uncharacterized membrane protein